jgi:hypothetical protein
MLDKYTLRASLASTFFHGISNFPRENELISLRKMKNPWENEVPKLALSGYWSCKAMFPTWFPVL